AGRSAGRDGRGPWRTAEQLPPGDSHRSEQEHRPHQKKERRGHQSTSGHVPPPGENEPTRIGRVVAKLRLSLVIERGEERGELLVAQMGASRAVLEVDVEPVILDD